MDKHFEKIALRFDSLLASLHSIFTESEKQAVQEFLEVGENALALETVIEIITEGNHTVSDDTNCLIEHLIELMRMHDSWIVMKYKNNRREN